MGGITEGKAMWGWPVASGELESHACTMLVIHILLHVQSTPPEKKMQEDRDAWMAWLKTYR